MSDFDALMQAEELARKGIEPNHGTAAIQANARAKGKDLVLVIERDFRSDDPEEQKALQEARKKLLRGKTAILVSDEDLADLVPVVCVVETRPVVPDPEAEFGARTLNHREMTTLPRKIAELLRQRGHVVVTETPTTKRRAAA